MKKIILMAFLLLILNYVYAQEELINSESLDVNIKIDGSMEIVPESSSYSIRNVIANLTFFPKNYFNQEVLNFDIEPEGEITDDSIKFEWNAPSEKKLSFGLNSEVRTYNKIIEIKDRIEFPIKELSPELEIYTKPSATIDSDNEEIVRLASELVEGEDDLYKVVFKLADWTKNNIQYNLSTLTAEVSQKASWVLENKEGVCDELTSLFIAMLRAVKIPARFVSGFSYTNSPLFKENWGAHGWAEVYFPDYGFIPFDVTYGEFGFIDATHIKMKEGIDSISNSVQYEWEGRNVNLKTEELEIKAELINKKENTGNFIELKADTIKDNVGFGSYNLIQVNVKNLKGYYLADEIYLSKTEGIEIIGENKKSILLKPNEEKNVFWVVKVNESLDNNFIYTFPLVVISSRNANVASKFNSEKNAVVYSLNEIWDILKNKEEEEEKKYSKEVNLNCSANKNEFYVYENALIDCDLKNIGNVFLNNLEICFENNCENFNLGIMQDKKLNFSANYSKAGQRDVPIKARNTQISKSSYISLNVLDKPEVRISNIEFPKNVSFKDKYDVVFVLEKISFSEPVDVEVDFEQNGFKKEWAMDKLLKDRRFVMNLQGNNLRIGKNDFKISVNYKDKNNKAYKTEESFFIELVNVNLWQRGIIFFNSTVKFLNGLSFRSLAIIVFSASFAFAVVIVYLLRKN